MKELWGNRDCETSEFVIKILSSSVSGFYFYLLHFGFLFTNFGDVNFGKFSLQPLNSKKRNETANASLTKPRPIKNDL